MRKSMPQLQYKPSKEEVILAKEELLRQQNLAKGGVLQPSTLLNHKSEMAPVYYKQEERKYLPEHLKHNPDAYKSKLNEQSYPYYNKNETIFDTYKNAPIIPNDRILDRNRDNKVF